MLVLLGEEPGAGPDVLVLQRAATLRNHAGQPAFPGGAADPEDADAARHRAARGERGGRARPVQRHRARRAAEAVDPGQRLRGHPGARLVARPAPGAPPGAGRGGARGPAAGQPSWSTRRTGCGYATPAAGSGPAFSARGMLVWGFTAGVLATLLEMGGWARPWPRGRVVELPPTGAAPAPSAGTDEVDERAGALT